MCKVKYEKQIKEKKLGFLGKGRRKENVGSVTINSIELLHILTFSCKREDGRTPVQMEKEMNSIEWMVG